MGMVRVLIHLESIPMIRAAPLGEILVAGNHGNRRPRNLGKTKGFQLVPDASHGLEVSDMVFVLVPSMVFVVEGSAYCHKVEANRFEDVKEPLRAGTDAVAMSAGDGLRQRHCQSPEKRLTTEAVGERI